MIKLYGHGGSENHGCEAIVRTTVNLFDESCVLFSEADNQDYYYGVDSICSVIQNTPHKISRYTANWWRARFQEKFSHEIDLAIKYEYPNFFRNLNSRDICLSIGGDTYCYTGTERLAAINKNIRKKKAKTVLWGCSVEPKLLSNEKIMDDLKSFDLITARESLSFNALKSINPNTILVSDTAFKLEKEELPLPKGWQCGAMVGINASPLILSSNSNSNVVLDSYRNLIKYILNETSYGVALIPHVVWKSNDDRTVLHTLYQEFLSSNRVVMIDDCNCMQLKGYISRCVMFIGARTHATIAAYSSMIPTLVLGYSIKSKGIAKDLFGDVGNYVIPVQNLNDNLSLVKNFCWLNENKVEIKRRLETTLPAYIERINDGKKAIENIKKRMI